MSIKQRLDQLEAAELAEATRANQRRPQNDHERAIRTLCTLSESAERLGVPCTLAALAVAGDRMAQIFLKAQQRMQKASAI